MADARPAYCRSCRADSRKGLHDECDCWCHEPGDAEILKRALSHAMAVLEEKSHGHCTQCHPGQRRRPLAVSGRGYRRRSRARVRRKRGQ
jgi:hypothetical protein